MKKLTLTFILFIFSIIFLNLSIVSSIAAQKNSSTNVFRLHVLPNSNSVSDKIIKLIVSCKIEDYIKNSNINSSNLNLLQIQEILDISNNILREKNVGYIATLKTGKISYNTKNSPNLEMPAGSYDSIQIILGNGTGENIWSLIFPNEKSIKNITAINTLVPGIENIFNNSNQTSETKYYSSIILETLIKIKKIIYEFDFFYI